MKADRLLAALSECANMFGPKQTAADKRICVVSAPSDASGTPSTEWPNPLSIAGPEKWVRSLTGSQKLLR